MGASRVNGHEVNSDRHRTSPINIQHPSSPNADAWQGRSPKTHSQNGLPIQGEIHGRWLHRCWGKARSRDR
ncbi:hypothetical protein [Leptolyngbya iicbica]|uniref:Uncharacterized protein n=2 Tax=Cyanophyceae TaxID=3028117 RepID=A0A4Q7EG65_9CYAN|nr:hypothetical protein [Leptolyngbya sp. LK]RZM82077.1 hypothetical protein DYY88_02110 [Leptolyngbya sp. LK]